jgi:hypothetical protein
VGLGRNPGRRLAGACAALALALVLTSPATADVPPGFDLFETDPETTVFSFRKEHRIGPGFFEHVGRESSAFEGDVHFGGVPLKTFREDIGDADTVIGRERGAVLRPPFPARNDDRPINLAALSLQSMAPIQVRVGSTTQLWDIRVDLSPPIGRSRGEMDIVQQSTQGGVFHSSLEFIPRFTFTRLSDGVQRTRDYGAGSRPQDWTKLVFRVSNVPWRPGCVSPALLVPSLNPGFCPSFQGRQRQKVLTLAQWGPALFGRAALGVHGVRPAQHRTEHFKCYDAASPPPFTRRNVRLTDRFGNWKARVAAPGAVCNPVQKNRERLVNRAAHLRCYALDRLSPSFRTRSVVVRNQFGSQVLRVTAPLGLCLPTRQGAIGSQQPPAITVVPDHFKCYGVRSRVPFRARDVILHDEFELRAHKAVTPVLLCNPVRKTMGTGSTARTTPIQHPVHHLVCYSIRDIPLRQTVPARRRFTLNQFGGAQVKTGRPNGLCVPSLTVPA